MAWGEYALLVRRIYFSGVDGAGKTSLVATAYLELRNCGLEPRILWMKSLHTLSYVVYRFVEKAMLGSRIDFSRMRLFPEWARKAGVAWELLEILSVFPWATVLLLEDRNKPLIVDRGPLDFVVTVAARSGGRIVYSRPFILLLNKFYKNSILFYLRIPPEAYRVVLERKRKQLEYSPRTLRSLIHYYDEIVGILQKLSTRVYTIHSHSTSLDNMREIVRGYIRKLFCRSTQHTS